MARTVKSLPTELFMGEITISNRHAWNGEPLPDRATLIGPYATKAAVKGQIANHHPYYGSKDVYTAHILRASITEWEEVDA